MPGFDDYDDPGKGKPGPGLSPSNARPIPKRQTAVALTAGPENASPPRIAAAGRGKLAEQILQLAFENGVPVREDSALAEMLGKIELDSPVPSEAFFAVAEIFSYVYRANGAPNPFDAIFEAAASPQNPRESEIGTD
jgi:flagellar biosynthesis protein